MQLLRQLLGKKSSLIFLLVLTLHARAQTPLLVEGSLIAPGNAPFHLKATVFEGRDDPIAQVETYWIAPDKWRRTIQSHDFSQTIVVNGEKRLEQNSADYFPIGLETLTNVMVDAKPILAEYQAGDFAKTKADGASTESGIICYDNQRKLCMMHAGGLMEIIAIRGHQFQFSNYESFHHQRIARRIAYIISVGDSETVQITQLEDLKHPDDGLFAIEEQTPASQRLLVEELPESDLRKLAVQEPEIIWPQVLDGATTGTASFYIGVDPKGVVREVEPVKTANERSNDSAIRQIQKWQFKPYVSDGVEAEVHGLLNFDLNTRRYGPADTLDDAQMRNMATNLVAPDVPAGKYPPGTEYKLWLSVDSDGTIIEQITDSGPPELITPCGRAIAQWHFKPIMENGQPRPYRGLVVFKF